MNDPEVSIVLPVRNQADHIGRVVGEYSAALRRLGTTFELILVVNRSVDDSLPVCLDLASESPELRVLTEDEPGWGRAVRRGLAASRGEMLCYTNSARTTSEMLALCVLYAQAYPEVAVKATRRTRDNLLRKLGSLIYNFECRSLFDLANFDINGTPKVFPRRFNSLLDLEQDGDLVDLEFLVRCREEGHRVIEVPVLATNRHGGRSTTSLRSAWNLYVGAMAMRRERRARRPEVTE